MQKLNYYFMSAFKNRIVCLYTGSIKDGDLVCHKIIGKRIELKLV